MITRRGAVQCRAARHSEGPPESLSVNREKDKQTSPSITAKSSRFPVNNENCFLTSCYQEESAISLPTGRKVCFLTSCQQESFLSHCLEAGKFASLLQVTRRSLHIHHLLPEKFAISFPTIRKSLHSHFLFPGKNRILTSFNMRNFRFLFLVLGEIYIQENLLLNSMLPGKFAFSLLFCFTNSVLNACIQELSC